MPQTLEAMTEPSLQEQDFPAVEVLITSRRSFPEDALVHAVADYFFRETSVDAVAILRDVHPVGLVTRHKLLHQVSRRFGWEIFRYRTIAEVMDRHPLTIPGEVQLDQALSLALGRSAEEVYDEIIVTRSDGTFNGLLSVRQMVIQQSQSLANIMFKKDLAHERARELERLSELKSQFLAHVTHELRSPVNAIIELGELINIAAKRGDQEQLGRRLSLMLSNAANLRALITNLLDLSKIEAGRMDVIVEEFDLVETLLELVETTRVLVGQKPVVVECSIEQSSMTVVNDSVKLRQILTNLASNAARFTDRGHIAFRLRAAGERNVIIEVEDTGIGIAEEDLDRLFTAFGQLEDASAKRFGGTGLGLAITRQLLELTGGSIGVTSRKGSGSTFTVSIPRSIQMLEEAHDDERT